MRPRDFDGLAAIDALINIGDLLNQLLLEEVEFLNKFEIIQVHTLELR